MTVKEFKMLVNSIYEKYDNETIYSDMFCGDRLYSDEIKDVEYYYSTLDNGILFNLSRE